MEKIRECREKSYRSEDERKSAGRAAEKFGKLGAHAPILRGFFRQSRTSAVREKPRTCGKRDERGRHGDGNGATGRCFGHPLGCRRRFRDLNRRRFFGNGNRVERAEDVRIRNLTDCGCRDGLVHRPRLGEKRLRLRFGKHREFHRNRRGSFRQLQHVREAVLRRNLFPQGGSRISVTLPSVRKLPVPLGFRWQSFDFERWRTGFRETYLPIFPIGQKIDSRRRDDGNPFRHVRRFNRRRRSVRIVRGFGRHNRAAIRNRIRIGGNPRCRMPGFLRIRNRGFRVRKAGSTKGAIVQSPIRRTAPIRCAFRLGEGGDERYPLRGIPGKRRRQCERHCRQS